MFIAYDSKEMINPHLNNPNTSHLKTADTDQKYILVLFKKLQYVTTMTL